MSVLSKLTAKAQTTIPRKARQKLELKPGDLIVFEIHGDVVQLRKVEPWMSVISAPSSPRFRSGDRLRTLKPTMLFERFDVVVVNFPFAMPRRANRGHP